MPKIVEKIKFRKQFTSVVSGKLESIYWGYLAPSEAARSHEYIERLVASQRMNTVPDATIQKWLSDLSDKRYEKLVKVFLVKPRSRGTLGPFLEDFISKLSQSENSLDNFRSSRDTLLAFFGEDRRLETITKQDAINYKEYLKTTGRIDGKGGYGQNSVSKKLQHAARFFQAMQDMEMISSNPFKSVREVPVDETDRKDYIPAEYCLKAMEYAPSAEWKLLIALWRFGGLRRSCEPLRLRWSDIDWGKRLIRVYSSKTKRERFVPIFPEIMEPLLQVRREAKKDAEWVIEKACPEKMRASKNREVGTKQTNLHKGFNDICIKAELKVYPMAGNNMRASCVKDLYSGKYPELRGKVDVIAKILGHSAVTALKYYNRYSTDELEPLTQSFDVKIPQESTECVKKCVAHEEKEPNPAHLMLTPPQENAYFVPPDAIDNTTLTLQYSNRG